MNCYPIEAREKEIGLIRKKKVKYYILKLYDWDYPLRKALAEYYSKTLKIPRKRAGNLLYTFPPVYLQYTKDGEDRAPFIISPTPEDAHTLHLFFQLIGIVSLLASGKITKLNNLNLYYYGQDALKHALNRLWHETEFFQEVLGRYWDESDDRLKTYVIHEKIDNVLKNPQLLEKFVDIVAKEYATQYNADKETIRKIAPDILKAARKLASILEYEPKVYEKIRKGEYDPLNKIMRKILEHTGWEKRKIVAEKKKQPTPKLPRTKKALKKPKIQTNPYSLTLEAQKLLGILNGLKYAGYSKEAVGSAVNDMLKRAEELAGKGELEALGLYLWTAHLLREGRFEDAEKFLKKES